MKPIQNGSSPYELTKEEFEHLLIPHFGSDLSVVDLTVTPFTQNGENYGSIMLAANLTILQGTKKYNLSLIAKLVPPSEFLREAFAIETTFTKEVNAYRLVSPEFERLQKENNVPLYKFLDIFPKFYGARTNKESNFNEGADETAVLLLENLKLSGYVTGDRMLGFDLEHLKLGVCKLARFHALSVALKFLKPKVFEETNKAACKYIVLGGVSKEEIAEKWITSALDDVKAVPECVPYLEEIEKSLREEMKERRNRSLYPPKEPFATFVHNDFWINNMMFKYETNGNKTTPVRMKFVDFQLTIYASPIKDLIFFIYSSAAEGVIENSLKELLDLYHQEFIDCLSGVGCDTGPFSYEHFQEELNRFAPREFPHLLYMIKFIKADKSKVPDLATCDVDEIVKNNYAGKVYEEKVKFLVHDFSQRGWL